MKNNSRLITTSIMVLSCLLSLQAQDSLKIRLKNEAQQYFMEKKYTEALPLYRELLNSFPKEPQYLYCTGVCLVMLNSDLAEAIRLLRTVSVSNYEPMAWYYLGRALHLYYSFEDAIKAYSRFILNGKSADVKSLQVERLIEMAKNGIEFTRTGRTVKVQSTRIIQTEQLQLAAENNGSGKLMKKPVEFCSKPDLRSGYRPWMFLPAYTEINEYVYVAGYEKNENNKKQLFRIKNINHEIWSTPELLSATINTRFDEEYPYFNSKTSELYFSSTGHSSMGGYDIFKSVYDWNTKSWSQPENLGFPINSPYDDYVFITDGFNQSASFVSTRNTLPNQATIYRIELEHDTTGVRFVSIDEIRQASLLRTEPEKIQPPEVTETMKIQDKETPVAAENKSLVSNDPPVKTDYNKALSEALILQLKSDSLARITRDMRLLAKETPDEEVKKQLVADIVRTDKAAKTFQCEADQKFNFARSLKIENAISINQQDSVLRYTGEINGISTYQYRLGTKEVITRDIQEPSFDEEPVDADKLPLVPVKADAFSILEKSPYDDSNPIPQGLELVPGLVYRIQLGVFSKTRPPDAFGGINPVAYEHITGSNVLKYYAGLFYSMNAVTAALDKVRSNGYPDAFVVAFMDGTLISTEKAREIEFPEFNLH